MIGNRRTWTLVTGSLIALVGVVALALVLVRLRSDPAPISESFDAEEMMALDDLSSGSGWRAVSGRFIAIDGAAAVAEVADEPAIAVIDGRSPVETITAAVSEPTLGSGIVFRYVDEENYWSLMAAPSYATWNPYKTVAGVPQFVQNTGLSYQSGESTLEISLSGSELVVQMNDNRVATSYDEDRSDGAGVGLISAAPAPDTTRWNGRDSLLR